MLEMGTGICIIKVNKGGTSISRWISAGDVSETVNLFHLHIPFESLIAARIGERYPVIKNRVDFNKERTEAARIANAAISR